MSEAVPPVVLCVVMAPPDKLFLLLREIGFRPARKTKNWWRFYDSRLSYHTEDRVCAEAMAEAHGLTLDTRPVRRAPWAKPTTRYNATPSAATWLNQNDPTIAAAKVKAARKDRKDKRQARTNTRLVGNYRRGMHL